MIVEAQNITAGFDPENAALTGVDLCVYAGESLAVRGASGSGKSTLLFVLAGLLPPAGGQVRIGGVDIYSLSDRGRAHVRRHQIGYVSQFGEMLPELDARENVSMPLLLQGVRSNRAFSEAERMLAVLGLEGYGRRDVRTLSGGELQRAAIARALIHKPAVVLADEPTGALDETNSTAVMSLLLRACAERAVAVIIATHDPLVAARTERVADIRNGSLTVNLEASGT